MTEVNTALNDTIGDLLDDWRVHLRARNRRPLTIQSYLETGRNFADYLAERGMPTQPAGIAREHVEAYLADATERGLSAATVARFYRNLQQLFRWLVDDGEIQRSPMANMRPPAIPE
ncbi:MAG TPA: site-specific integrase, partial [Actinomycetes bacterium]